ncbi:prolactin receptor a [Anoplopoma fimbria]|uniref:prolactin receptor a n=1 Tax=Anoplopoma fimbria TaxID=229290 RepID=UPI0023EB41F3|nr:prolactin receptor a [Anoplopoma fimbria]
MMRKIIEVILLSSLLFFAVHARGKPHSPPGKPALTSCRSPEKETFTCWWEPGSDGGLHTTYALYYRKETSEKVYECPDYRTAGDNSCFFNKNHTAIWVLYNITVVATNAKGQAFSDPWEIDVVNIVKPHPPEKVTVTVLEDKRWPFLRVSWEPPHKADTRSGWITLIYELRVRLEEENDWEMHVAGQQKMFNIFSPQSGGKYLVEVRCKPDHGFWSEWSSTSYSKVPEYFHRETSAWILITVFSTFTFLILTWLLHMNRHNLKHCILPPVPGPKIKGFDKQLLKNGKSNEIVSALLVPDFPPTASSNYEDLLVECLEVYVPKERQVVLEESKDLHDGGIKSENSTSDSDSGRGSCDSRTLLMDKCDEAKEEEEEERQTDLESGRMQSQVQRRLKDWEEEALTYAHGDSISPDMSSGRVKTWPSVFSPLPQYSSSPLDQQSSLEMSKQHSLSTSSYLTGPGHGAREALGQNYFFLSSKQPHLLNPHTPVARELQVHSDVDISRVGLKQAPAGLRSPAPRTTEYVEVQRVNHEDMVLLQPVVSGCGRTEGRSQMPQGEVYSKVKSVDSENILLLQREGMEEDWCPSVDQETNEETGNCYASYTVSATQKPSACIYTAMPIQDETALTVNGYVDTATMCTLNTC